MAGAAARRDARRGLRRPHRLVLIARGRPWGDARIELELEEQDGGCLVRMHEEAVKGLGRLLHTPATDVVLRGRNHEALGRLQAVAERRTSPDD
ncbi:hypothetical protein GCM10025868_29220 [Angustibacter aerolatus]|uniref:Uncharacterized protein n=1 Tax=Angustibacter aerolatus TaxID=1162965 RepID=A0ABQ6JHG0_9ACTN|nr:hypothetical protein GCM10025868_29220 [Angustibacter aerolatus]